jgi:transcriptional regulator with XRE-family HTH domain
MAKFGAYMAPTPASRIFGRRLQETRRARGVSQTELADAMTEAGYEMGKTAVLRIENGTRELKLDEAIAFAQLLHVPFAYLLEPPHDGEVALTKNIATDGDGMKRWLVTGTPLGGLVWPEQMRTRQDRELAAAYLRDLAIAATAAALAGDKQAQRRANRDLMNAVSRIGDAGQAVVQTRQSSPNVVGTTNHRATLECGCEVPVPATLRPGAAIRCATHGPQRPIRFTSDPIYESEEENRG